MKLLLRIFSIIIPLILGSCFSPTAENSLSFIVLGIPTDNNPQSTYGYIVSYYCHIDLNKNTVICRYYQSNEEKESIQSKFGSNMHWQLNDSLMQGIKTLESLPSGEIQSTKIKEGTLYCGPDIYVILNKKGASRYYHYRFHHLNTSIENMSKMIFALQNHTALTSTNGVQLNEDSLVSCLINNEEIQVLPFPYPTLPTSKFQPPTP